MNNEKQLRAGEWKNNPLMSIVSLGQISLTFLWERREKVNSGLKASGDWGTLLAFLMMCDLNKINISK